MAINTATVTLDLVTLLGETFDARRTKVWATTNIDNGTIIDTETGRAYLGSGTVSLSGSIATLTLPTPGDSNPASWQTTIHVDYPDPHTPRGRETQSYGPFTITEDVDFKGLVDEQEVPPAYLTTVTQQLDEKVTQAEDAAAYASAVSGADTADDLIVALDANPASTFRQQQDARHIATIGAELDALDVGGATPLGREVLRAPDQATAQAAIGVNDAARELVAGGGVTLTEDGASVIISAANGSQAGIMASIPRHSVKDASVSTISGNLRLSYFTANRSASFSKVRAVSGSTAAAATPTLCRYAVFSVHPASGDLTRIGRTDNAPGILAATGTPYELALESPVAIEAGKRYALALLVITTATAPTVHGVVHLNAVEAGVHERLNGNVGGQTDIISSIPGTSVNDSTSNPYLALVP